MESFGLIKFNYLISIFLSHRTKCANIWWSFIISWFRFCHMSPTQLIYSKKYLKQRNQHLIALRWPKLKGDCIFMKKINYSVLIQNLNDSKTRASPTSLVGGGIFILVTREWPLTRILVCQWVFLLRVYNFAVRLIPVQSFFEAF